MWCIQVSASIETWLKILVKQNVWNEARGFIGGGRGVALLWDVMSRE